ncbi:MAG: ATPase domain-containing protein [Roseiflexaceae bacterium]
MNEKTAPSEPDLVATGIAGFDEIIGGGFPRNRLYLIEGNPGSGKTTLALRYLLEGARRGERGLYITLSETAEELRAVAASHGWSLDGVDLVELIPSDESLTPDSQYTMFHPSEVELAETTKAVLAEVERINPRRAVFDSLSEMRLLAQNSLRYRRQILALKQFFIGRQCTVLLLDDRTAESTDLQLQSIAHGVVSLEQLAPEYGAERRRLCVQKMRGRKYRGGFHDFRIVRGGLSIYPRLIAAEHHEPFEDLAIVSDVPELDMLLGGGLDRGTSALLIGPAGVGKSTLAIQYAVAAAHRGENATLFAFDESIKTMLLRSAGIGIDLAAQIAAGRIQVRQVDPAELSPGEFVQEVRRAVEQDDSRILIIDSLNGYINAMPEERYLLIQMHELFTYLGQRGVTTFLIVAQHGLVGRDMQSPIDASYLADTVILLRYFEARGEIRQAISVMKKRSGLHERTIRELRIDKGGVHVGAPLSVFQGVLKGTPQYIGHTNLLSEQPDGRTSE